jgi:hypothetical protein
VSPVDRVRLLERLLSDPDFRSRFRADPAAAAREGGFALLADLIEADGAGAMETLEMRESRGSLAGVAMAGMIEGLGLFDLVDHGASHLGAGPGPAADPPTPGAAGGSPPAALVNVASAPPRPPPAVPDPSPEPAAPDDLATPARTNAVVPTDVPDPDPMDAGDDGGDDPDEDEDEDEDEGEDEDEDENEDENENEDEPDEEEPDEVGPDQDDMQSEFDGGAATPDEPDPDAPDADREAAPHLAPAPDGYPGDAASREQVGAWMARAAQQRGLPPELPVMAAMVESGVRNLPGGDADSVGLFQMRLGIWNNGAYADYPERAELQLDWFLDRAEAVKAQRLARGLPVDSAHYGEWIADVERPAERYRGHYQLRLGEAQALLRRWLPDGDGLDAVVDAGSGSDLMAGPRATAALVEAYRHHGTPYLWGGESPKTGFDCSGLVQWSYAKAGIRIPRVTDQQFVAPGAIKVGRKNLLPGDLVFFRDSTGYIHHVGMSLGGDRFIEAPRTGLKVRISSLDEPYYAQQFAGGRRFDAPITTGGRFQATELPAVRRGP